MLDKVYKGVIGHEYLYCFHAVANICYPIYIAKKTETVGEDKEEDRDSGSDDLPNI